MNELHIYIFMASGRITRAVQRAEGACSCAAGASCVCVCVEHFVARIVSCDNVIIISHPHTYSYGDVRLRSRGDMCVTRVDGLVFVFELESTAL